MSELWMDAHMLIVCWHAGHCNFPGHWEFPGLWLTLLTCRCSLCKIPLSSCDFISSMSVL